MRRLPALTLLLALFAFPSIAQAQPEPSRNLAPFFESSFDYCDAKLMSEFWGEMIGDAKASMADKIQTGGEVVVENALKQAREKALASGTPTCSIYEMGYTAADAAALATVWGYSQSDAKAAMFNKMLNGGKEGLRSALKSAGAPSVAPKPAPTTTAQTPMQAFTSSKVHYCDAKVMAAMWGTSVETAKTSIGHKLLGGNHEILRQERDRAYSATGSPSCEWTEVRFDYNDAQLLAGVWEIGTAEAKVRIAQKVSFGNSDLVDEMLMTAGGGN